MFCNIKKFLVFIIILISLLLGDAPAISKPKFKGNFLTSFHAYQLGTYEFVLKIYGKHLPLPSDEDFSLYENTMQIILENTKVKNTQAMKLLTENLENSVPLISSINIENISDDKVSIFLESISPMTLEAADQGIDGLTFRISTEDKSEKASLYDMENISIAPVKNYPTTPKNTLYFSAEEKITVDLRDADLRDVLRILMDQLGRNTIIDSSFPQGIFITMSLKSVRIDEVLNYLLKTYDIACYRAGANVVAFGMKNDLYKLSGEREVKSFKIAYAELEKASAMLKSLVTLQDSEVTADERMRTLHVNTNPAKMEEVEKAIKIIDVPSRQVMIRASIFEFTDEATAAVQHSLEMVYDKWRMNLDLSSGVNLLTYNDDTYKNGKTNFDRYITATLSGLETKDKGKTVANPSVIAVDGQEASIKLKQEILYRKGLNKDGAVEWDTKEVGPELKFKPLIEDNGYVYLEITIKTGDYLGSDGEENIRTTNREVTTKVRVKDGMPFVVGGLNMDTDVRMRNKIPIVGNIPLLGELFSYSSKEKNKAQAVMIVTPYIITDR